MIWLFGPKKPDTPAHLGRDDRMLGVRLDRGRGQKLKWRLDKSECLDSLDEAPDGVADPMLKDSAQRALVEELEREFDLLPDDVKAELSGDLTVAKNAILRGEKIPSMTLSHLTQVKNDQETRNVMKNLVVGLNMDGCALGIRGGESVGLSARLSHGLDNMIGNIDKSPGYGFNGAFA